MREMILRRFMTKQQDLGNNQRYSCAAV